ncbi:MAG: HPP family protein [Polyangiales bacterium]
MTTTVAEIMTRGVLTIAPGARIAELRKGLHEVGIDGAPVMDPSGHVLGVVSKTDLLDLERIARRTHKTESDLTVEDVMTPVVVAVRMSDSAMYAVERMIDLGVHRVVVVDERDHPAGIVTAMDVLRALHHGRLVTEPESTATDADADANADADVDADATA